MGVESFWNEFVVGVALFAVQQSLYQMCTNDATLLALATGVFDATPENQPFPYIVIGEGTEVPWNTFGRRGRQTTVTNHVWSQATTNGEASAIIARMNVLLHRKVLGAMAGYENVLCLYDMSQVFPDADGLSIHGIVRYRLLSQEGTP